MLTEICAVAETEPVTVIEVAPAETVSPEIANWLAMEVRTEASVGWTASKVSDFSVPLMVTPMRSFVFSVPLN